MNEYHFVFVKKKKLTIFMLTSFPKKHKKIFMLTYDLRNQKASSLGYIQLMTNIDVIKKFRKY